MTAEEFVYNSGYIYCDSEDSAEIISVENVIKILEEYARIKCLEAIKNVRHKACDIIAEKHGYQIDEDNLPFILKSIQNISNKDVMPEL